MVVMCEYKSIVRRSSIYTYVGIDFIVVIGIVKVLQCTETCKDRKTASTLQLENQENGSNFCYPIKFLISWKIQSSLTSVLCKYEVVTIYYRVFAETLITTQLIKKKSFCLSNPYVYCSRLFKIPPKAPLLSRMNPILVFITYLRQSIVIPYNIKLYLQIGFFF